LSADPRWRLRRASADDAAALSLVAGATFLEAFAGVLDGADIVAHVARNSSAAAFAHYMAKPGHVATLAELTTGAAPAGYTLLTPPDLPVDAEAGDIELKRIYALATEYGSGLGAALLERAFDDARAMGRRRMVRGVYGGTVRAHRFYEKHGFAVVGARRFLVGATWHDDRIYGRPL